MAKRWTPPPLGTRYGPWTLTAHLGLVDGRRTVTATHTCGHTHTGPLTELTNTPCPNCPTTPTRRQLRTVADIDEALHHETDPVRRLELIQRKLDRSPLPLTATTGRRYGKLVVDEYLGCPVRPHHERVLATCDCGNTAEYSLDLLVRGAITRCDDCARQERIEAVAARAEEARIRRAHVEAAKQLKAQLREERLRQAAVWAEETQRRKEQQRAEHQDVLRRETARHHPIGSQLDDWVVTGLPDDPNGNPLLTVTHHCGATKTVQADRVGTTFRCDDCVAANARAAIEAEQRRNQEWIEAAQAAHPVGSTIGEWEITGHVRVPWRVLLTARHTCGAEVETTASQLTGDRARRPIACICETEPDDLAPGTRQGTLTIAGTLSRRRGVITLNVDCDCGHRFGVRDDKWRNGVAVCRQCAKRKAS